MCNCNFQVKNVQHKQETRFQSSSMEEGAMKYYSASDRRTGEGVQGWKIDTYPPLNVLHIGRNT